MKVAIIKIWHHPLYDELVKHLATLIPKVDVKIYEATHPTFKEHDLEDWFRMEPVEAVIILPPYYLHAEPEQYECVCSGYSLSFIGNSVLKYARRWAAKVVLISEAQARLHDAFRHMSVVDTHYGFDLHKLENTVREYERGIVLSIPLLNTDPWITSNEMAGRDSLIGPKEPDVIFSLADAGEVAETVCEAITSGWYGIHQLGGQAQTLRLSDLIGHKAIPESTYNYSLSKTGIVPSLKIPAIDIWKKLRNE